MKVNTILLLLLILSINSCCIFQKSSKNNQNDMDKNTNISFYKTLSERQIKDELKKQDAPYIYDYEVDLKEIYSANNKDLIALEKLLLDESNYLSNEVISQCNPNPDFFIEWENGDVFGFHLNSNCPVVFHIVYEESTPKLISHKYILISKKHQFETLINKIKE